VFPRQVAPSTVVVGKRIVRRAEVCRGDRHRTPGLQNAGSARLRSHAIL
jgi:hypothetical protein